MPDGDFFDRNILDTNIRALSQTNPLIPARLSGVRSGYAKYKVLESRSGERVPAHIDENGAVHALHSMIDPRKEARRLIDTADEGFLVLLGLGGGFYAEAALDREGTGIVLVIEFDSEGFSELISLLDYSRLFGNPRFRLLLDNSIAEIGQSIQSLYQPALFGGIRVIPLRPRTGLEVEPFMMAGNAVQAAIDRISSDYSVQAHFGKRWFSNTVRNLMYLDEKQDDPSTEPIAKLSTIRRAAVCAAGPSLSLQIPRLKEKREDIFLIAVDTSLPCLLHRGLIPDAVISIDCQHIGYYHFMDGLPEETQLFLDLASPPLLAAISKRKHFFTGGHPLTRYISQSCKPLPELDTSGGNVTYAAVSLAEQLGAYEIELYGADFSYPLGVSYARGSYIYPFFANRQNRLFPLEAQASAFLYRTKLEKKGNHGGHGGITEGTEEENGKKEKCAWYYETGTLKLYRERLEEKCQHMEAALIPVEGQGAPINVRQAGNLRKNPKTFSYGRAMMKAEDFLRFYREGITSLPDPGKNVADYLAMLSNGQRVVITTLLPTIAAIKKRESAADFRELIEETRAFCLAEIDTVLGLLEGGVNTQEPACAGESIINFLSNEEPRGLPRGSSFQKK